MTIENDALEKSFTTIEVPCSPYNTKEIIRICPRYAWGAAPPAEVPNPPPPLQHPINVCRFTHTDTDTCYGPEECIPIVRGLQKQHMESEGLADIKYNFLVGGDGLIYEGRGWNVEADRDAEFYYLKGQTIDFGYIGRLFDKQNQPNFPTKQCERTAYTYATYADEELKYMIHDFTVFQFVRKPGEKDPGDESEEEFIPRDEKAVKSSSNCFEGH